MTKFIDGKEAEFLADVDRVHPALRVHVEDMIKSGMSVTQVKAKMNKLMGFIKR